MSGPSEGLAKLSSIHGPKASALGSLSIQDNSLRSYTHLRVIDAESDARTDALEGSSLSAEHINKCMLLLLVICVVLASTILGAVGYLSDEQRPSAESRTLDQLGVEP
jgi:hypothetical protein